MINNCSICKKTVNNPANIRFLDLIGSESEEYIQHIGICKKCGFIFTQNPFTEEQLENRYKNLSKFEYDDTNYDYIINDVYKNQCIRQKNFIDEAIGEDNYSSVFEVGAASGYNLSYYKECGKSVGGVEPSKLNCNLAKRKYDVDMFNGMFSEYIKSNQAEKYDIVFLSMVLEHIVDPFSFIKECTNISNKYIFIEVPTLDYKIAEEPYGMFCEEHVNIFTRESLTNLMNAAGYVSIAEEILFKENLNLPAGYPSLCTLWEKNNGEMTVGINPMITSDKLLEMYLIHNNKLLKDVEKRIESIDINTNIAIWGVGHHVAMLLGETSLAKKNIVAVYDGDERKSGIKIQGIPITVFDINEINEKKIDKVIVTTYTAQKAIKKYILKNGWDLEKFIFLYESK